MQYLHNIYMQYREIFKDIFVIFNFHIYKAPLIQVQLLHAWVLSLEEIYKF